MEPQTPDMEPLDTFVPADGGEGIIHRLALTSPDLLRLLQYAEARCDAGDKGLVLAQITRIAETDSARLCAVFIEGALAAQIIALVKERSRGFAHEKTRSQPEERS